MCQDQKMLKKCYWRPPSKHDSSAQTGRWTALGHSYEAYSTAFCLLRRGPQINLQINEDYWVVQSLRSLKFLSKSAAAQAASATTQKSKCVSCAWSQCSTRRFIYYGPSFTFDQDFPIKVLKSNFVFEISSNFNANLCAQFGLKYD